MLSAVKGVTASAVSTPFKADWAYFYTVQKKRTGSGCLDHQAAHKIPCASIVIARASMVIGRENP